MKSISMFLAFLIGSALRAMEPQTSFFARESAEELSFPPQCPLGAA